MKYFSTLIVFTSLFWMGCKNDHPAPTPAPTPTKAYERVSPTFSGDSAFAHVAKQVGFGPRTPGSAGWKACGNFIVDFLKSQGAVVKEQTTTIRTFDGKQQPVRNIIAHFNPGATKRVLLAAHWDTRPFSDQDDPSFNDKPIDGANDGGSGVGVLLELSRLLKAQSPKVGVDMVFFDLEDYGQPDNSSFPPMNDSYCLGSQYWANSAEAKNYKPLFGILLDMVGAPNARFSMEGTSMRQAPEVVKKVWNQANEMGFADRFPFFEHGGIIDDHYYVHKITGIPMIDIIEFDPETQSGFSKTWHTQRDNLGGIDRETLRIIGQTVAEVIYREP